MTPLFDRDGLRLGELAAAARLSKQAMPGLVKLCERDGLVARDRDPADGRVFNVRLTARGRESRSTAEQILRELDDELIEALGRRLQVVNHLGEFFFAIEADRASGVIDMFAGPSTLEMAVFPTRAVTLPDARTAYTFTMFRHPACRNDLFDSQHASLQRELAGLERLLAV